MTSFDFDLFVIGGGGIRGLGWHLRECGLHSQEALQLDLYRVRLPGLSSAGTARQQAKGVRGRLMVDGVRLGPNVRQRTVHR